MIENKIEKWIEEAEKRTALPIIVLRIDKILMILKMIYL